MRTLGRPLSTQLPSPHLTLIHTLEELGTSSQIYLSSRAKGAEGSHATGAAGTSEAFLCLLWPQVNQSRLTAGQGGLKVRLQPLMATPSCLGSSPRGHPARASDPCLASVGLLEFWLGLSSAACLLLLWNAGLNAWLPPAAGDGSFSTAPGKGQLLPQCPVQRPRPQPDGLVTK